MQMLYELRTLIEIRHIDINESGWLQEKREKRQENLQLPLEDSIQNKRPEIKKNL